MFRNLEKYGLTLGGIRIESGLPNLSDANATYTMNVLNTLVRVWLDRLEVFFLDLSRTSREQVSEIAEAVLDAIQCTSPDIEIETYTATLAMHGTVRDTGSCTAILRIIHSVPKPATMPLFHHHLRGHCHGADSLFLPPRACGFGVRFPPALRAVAQ